MPKNLIYLCKNRTVSIDRILPVLMKIKKINPRIRPMIVLWDRKHYDTIEANHDLWDGSKAINSRIYVMRGANKFLTLINLIRFIFRLLFKNNIILKDADVLPLYNIVIKVLKRLSRVTEIKVYLGVQFPSYLKNIYIQSILYRERAGLSMDLDIGRGEYDYFISALTKAQWKESFNTDFPERKMVKVGYVYKLPEWERFRKKAVGENKAIQNDYFFYILHATYQRRSLLDEPDVAELIEESLNILKKYNSKIKTIFKPHTATDLGKVKELLDKTGYSNYVFDYSHPMVLSSNAKFVFGNIFSSIMFMAYYLGRPTVEYSQYDPELFTKIGKQSLGGKYCDFFIHRDKKELDEVLDKLINGGVKVERDPDFIRTNFQDTPREFYDFWHRLLY